jgi:hypothetical protein
MNRAPNAILEEFRAVIDRSRKEWTISYAEIIGCLRILSREMEDEMLEVEARSSEEDDENDG